MLKKSGWFEFLMMFHGQNRQVAESFVLSFDGQYAKIRDIILQVDEAMISRDTKLRTKGERWSKTKRIK